MSEEGRGSTLRRVIVLVGDLLRGHELDPAVISARFGVGVAASYRYLRLLKELEGVVRCPDRRTLTLAMDRGAVWVGGRLHAPRLGMETYAQDPPRLVSQRLRQRCTRCRQSEAQWVTHDCLWRQVPRRWWKAALCLACWRALRRPR